MSKELTDQITELQSQFAFQEDGIQELSEALYNQQKRMDEMERQIQQLRNELEKAREVEPNQLAEPEVPPHYWREVFIGVNFGLAEVSYRPKADVWIYTLFSYDSSQVARMKATTEVFKGRSWLAAAPDAIQKLEGFNDWRS